MAKQKLIIPKRQRTKAIKGLNEAERLNNNGAVILKKFPGAKELFKSVPDSPYKEMAVNIAVGGVADLILKLLLE